MPDPGFWGPEPGTARRQPRVRRAEPDRPRRAAPAWWESALDRVRDTRVEVGIGVVAVALVAVVAGVVWYGVGIAGGAPPTAGGAARDSQRARAATHHPTSAPTAGRTPAGVPAGPPATASAVETRRGPTVVVHVAGAVVKPGVLRMPAGARVIDAIEGAGGAAPDADLDRLNLAAKLVDGQRILVVKVGAVGADPTAATPGGGPGALIDLNAATSAQLEEIPGIGPALAAAIIGERERRGGFRSVNELREVRGIGEARFADLRNRVTV
ncbi:MAG: helix-hairpin-helix domain-containing protein [Actinomycetota bacterium]